MMARSASRTARLARNACAPGACDFGRARPSLCQPTPAPSVSLLCALRLLRHIASAARAAPVGGGALRQPTGRGLQYAIRTSVVDVTCIADAAVMWSSRMRMRRAKTCSWHHARPDPKNKPRIAGTVPPARCGEGCVGICGACRMCDRRRRAVLNHPCILWRARDRGPMDPGPMALARPAIPRPIRAPRWPSVRAWVEFRRCPRHEAHRPAAEVAAESERRSAGRDGKDCGAEQGGGTERPGPDAIGRGSREIFVHGITFEVDCDHPQLPVGDLAWLPRSPMLLAFTWRLRALPPVDSALRSVAPPALRALRALSPSLFEPRRTGRLGKPARARRLPRRSPSCR